MPWSLPLRPSRRSLLAAAAGTAGAVLLTGCTDGRPAAGDPEGPPERRMREAAVRDSRAMLERYDATLAAHPALAGRLAPLRAAVAAHVTALDPDQPRRTPSATPSATGAPAAAGAPKASGTPQASGAPAEAVPAKPEEAVTALAEAERDLAETRTVALAEAPGELARLLASVAACGAVHHHLLTSTPGAAQ